ncbi:hypothetical protein AKO1_014669 [Acrasis kona]|uniref:Uncharacterized protein n=1 Tax=Acrasis kona TaxID=1008807 RepID=A0AAW2Z247_9EUKA
MQNTHHTQFADDITNPTVTHNTNVPTNQILTTNREQEIHDDIKLAGTNKSGYLQSDVRPVGHIYQNEAPVVTQIPTTQYEPVSIVTTATESLVVPGQTQPVAVAQTVVQQDTFLKPNAYHYKQDSGVFENFTHQRTLSRGTVEANKIHDLEKRVEELCLQQTDLQEFNQDTLRAVSCAGKQHLWGLSHGKDLYHMHSTPNGMEWQFFPTAGLQFKDISVSKGGTLFAIGATDSFVYKLDPTTTRMDLVVPGDTTRLRQVSASTRNKVYGLAEDGTVLYLSADRWERMGGKLKKISSGGKHLFRKTEVWGIGFDDRAMRWDQKGMWEPINEELIDISVAADNAIYGIRKQDQQLVKWDGEKFVKQAPPTTTGAEPQSKWRLTNVSAYKESKHVYAVEAGTGNVLKMSNH